MKIHNQGFGTIAVAVIVSLLLIVIIILIVKRTIFFIPLLVIIFGLLGLIFWFFRVPFRTFDKNEKLIYAPADGKIVVIEKTFEPEYFKDERIQVSVFMSPLNVHANFYPVSGKVVYTKYHEGKYLVAWHPKSSTKNERSTVVIRNNTNEEILVRQIAGAVARRIVPFSHEGQEVKQGDELGFIKFGSRVDIFLPLDTKINVELNQVSRAMQTIIAEFQ